ncbi:hypothetical protein Pcinc_003203 [Petrolisthes cinctipes]|uniref:Reverse transcriptase domain-containing protein n=1 Tax=Petrolisthes cinctipes TaxID=88211 RepID=A0AAE1GH89_PETCI|nr:hypothetical protein Pcinc_003203 [Petrolisthes cinctipes]
MFDQARALESAQKDSEVYGATQLQRVVSVAASSQATSEEPAAVTATVGSKCFFCGYSRHPRLKCPARESVCHKCHKKGHFVKVCRAASTTATTTSASASRNYATLAAVISAITPKSLSSAVVRVMIKGTEVDGLIDSGSSKSFIHPDVVQRLSLATHSLSEKVAMASTNLSTNTMGFCQVDLKVSGQEYHGVRLTVLPQLCSEVILGQDFQRLHDSVTLDYGGELPPLVVCGLSTLKVDPPKLFANLTADCQPFSAKSRRYSYDDRMFIEKETQRLLKEGIIEPSNSPWRAQVVVVKGDCKKPRLAIDYSETINKFTLLDGYPLPRIDDTVNKIAKYQVFSTIDLRSAYHQVPIRDEEKLYTAFEASGGLYQFTRVPFRVTNGVACFQRIMDTFIQEEQLEGTYAYLDNVTICGKSQKDHDNNLEKFLDAASRKNISYNEEKCIFATKKLSILGYVVGGAPVEIPIIEESRNTPVETGENVNKPLDATPSEVTEPVQRVDPLLPLQNSEPCEEAPILRRSERIRHPPVRYEYRKF